MNEEYAKLDRSNAKVANGFSELRSGRGSDAASQGGPIQIPGEYWQNATYAPEFFHEAAKMFRAGKQYKWADRVEQVALKWEVAEALWGLFSWIHGKRGKIYPRVVVPAPAGNRRERRKVQRQLRTLRKRV